MALLAINTSGQYSDVAIQNGEQIVERFFDDLREQDVELAGLVSDICNSAGVGFKSITRIGVVVGPGSFTGLRVGLAFAKGLGLVLKIPVIGVTSLEATLNEKSDKEILVALSAKRRPPERTWWVQLVKNDQFSGEAYECDIDTVKEFARTYQVEICSDTPECFNLSANKVVPRSVNVIRVIAAANPQLRPPKALYVRKPDATPRVA